MVEVGVEAVPSCGTGGSVLRCCRAGRFTGFNVADDEEEDDEDEGGENDDEGTAGGVISFGGESVRGGTTGGAGELLGTSGIVQWGNRCVWCRGGGLAMYPYVRLCDRWRGGSPLPSSSSFFFFWPCPVRTVETMASFEK